VSHRRYSVQESGTDRPAQFPPEALARIESILTRYPTKQAALLPLLWVAHETWGWISKEAAEEVARILGLPPAHVDGVLTFYTMYNLRPVGKNLIQVCTSISCHLAGAEGLIEHCRRRLGVELEGTTADGKFSLVEVECIAGCDKAPSIMINDTYYEPVDVRKMDEIIDRMSADA